MPHDIQEFHVGNILILTDTDGQKRLLRLGVILADIIANPSGTTAAGNVIGGIDKTNTNALLGKAS